MTDTRKVQVGTQMDTTGATKGFQAIQEGARHMATDVAASGAKAATGLDQVGTGSADAAQKVDRSTRTIIASVERATAAMKAGEKGSAAYFEQLGQARGANLEQLRPYIEQLRQLESQQQRVGISVGQTTAALRQLPAQFTDIVTSLTSGQAPLTVFIQQGGQIKDSFGGAGNAIKAMGGYVMSLVTPVTLAVAALGALAFAFHDGAEEARRFERSIIQSGGAAGVTATQYAAMAGSVSLLSGGTVSKAVDVLLAMSDAGVQGAASLQRYSAAVLAMERAGGPAVEALAAEFQKLSDAPLEASIKLNKSQNYLTASLYEQIKALQDQGRATEAARVAQDAYAAALESRAPAMAAQIGSLERGWKAVVDWSKQAVDALRGIGRPTGLEEKLVDTLRAIQALQGSTGGFGYTQAERQQEVQRLQERANMLSRQIALQHDLAAASSADTEATKAKIEWDRMGLEYLDKETKMRNEIAAARAMGAVARKSEAEIEQFIAAIREKYADKGAAGKATRQLEEQAQLLAELSGLSGSFAKDWANLNAAYARGAISAEQLNTAQAALLAKQPFMREEARKLAEANKEAAKARDAVTKAYEDSVEAAARSASGAEQQLQKARDEVEGAKLAMSANIGLAEAIERVVLARLHERQQIALKDGRQEEADAIKREIEARRELAKVMGEKETADTAKKAADAIVKENQRIAEDLDRSLTDALMRGFEAGKGYAENLRDAVKSMFGTMVLRPVIQAIVQPISGGLMSLLVGNSANASTGASGISGLASSWFNMVQSGMRGVGGNLGNLGSLFSTAGNFIGSGSLAAFGSGINTAGTAGSAGAQYLAGSAGYGSAYGAGSAVGTSAPWVGAGASALAMMMAARSIAGAISGNLSVGGSPQRSINIGTLGGTLLGGGLFGGALGSLLGGAVNRLFGMGPQEVTESGISGSFGGGDFSGQAYADWKQKGGWFRSNKYGTNFGAVGEELEQQLDASARSTLLQAEEWAKVLGLPAEALDKVTTTFRTKLTGNAEEDQKAVEALLAQYQSALTSQFSASLDPFKKAGETLTETFERLAGIQVFSDNINDLGGVFSRVAGLSVGAKESLLELVGGMDEFVRQAQGYVGNYYSREEIAGGKAAQVRDVLASVGINTEISSTDPRAQFRQLVESTDVSTPEGQKRLAALLGIQGDFADLSDYMNETGKSLSQVASEAPASSILAPLLASSASQQVAATNEVRDAILELTEIIKQQGGDSGGSSFVNNAWREVGLAESAR